MKLFTLRRAVGFCLLAAAFSTAFLFTACDDPTKKEELLLDARLKMDNGDCQGALEQVGKITDMDDRVYNTLGWARMCVAGAPFYKVGASVLSYQSGGALTVVGKLANALIPQSYASVQMIGQAAAAFAQIQNKNIREFSTGVAYLTQAAAMIAEQSHSGAPIKPYPDISANAACTKTNSSACTCVVASCMPDAGIATKHGTDNLITAITNASNALNSNTELKQLVDLINQLGGLGAGDATRTAIVGQMLE